VRPAGIGGCCVSVKSPKGEKRAKTKPSTPVGRLNEVGTPAAERASRVRDTRQGWNPRLQGGEDVNVRL
jgi:hypothetical protein